MAHKHHDRMKHTAMFRATIVAYFNSAPIINRTVAQLLEVEPIKVKMQELEYNKTHLAAHLKSLADAGIIKGEKDGHAYKFSSKGTNGVGVVAVKQAAPAKPERVAEPVRQEFKQLEMVDVEVSGVTISMTPGTHIYVGQHANGRKRVVIV